jgi:hypothetical protein
MQISNRTYLLLIIGVAEAATGAGFILVPASLSRLLLGLESISSEAFFFAQIAGAALLCIGVGSWSSRTDDRSVAQNGQLIGLTIWNGLAAGVLAYAALGLKLSGILLWPAFVVHVVLALWCAADLRPISGAPG